MHCHRGIQVFNFYLYEFRSSSILYLLVINSSSSISQNWSVHNGYCGLIVNDIRRNKHMKAIIDLYLILRDEVCTKVIRNRNCNK